MNIDLINESHFFYMKEPDIGAFLHLEKPLSLKDGKPLNDKYLRFHPMPPDKVKEEIERAINYCKMRIKYSGTMKIASSQTDFCERYMKRLTCLFNQIKTPSRTLYGAKRKQDLKDIVGTDVDYKMLYHPDSVIIKHFEANKHINEDWVKLEEWQEKNRNIKWFAILNEFMLKSPFYCEDKIGKRSLVKPVSVTEILKSDDFYAFLDKKFYGFFGFKDLMADICTNDEVICKFAGEKLAESF